MASLKEAFEDQGTFYRDQQTKFQEYNPKRFVPDSVKGTLDLTNAQDIFNTYDPYTGKTTQTVSAPAIAKIFNGQPTTTPQELACRTNVGYSGLLSLKAKGDTSQVRCGIRYKKSSGITPTVMQGALGTIDGPLNEKEDPLGSGVKWYWSTAEAEKEYLKDLGKSLAVPQGLDLLTGPLAGKLGWCVTTNKYIPIDSAGKPLYPNDPQLSCSATNLYKTYGSMPDNTQPLSVAQTGKVASIQALTTCANPGSGVSLSRDCFLQAVKNNGCTPDGTLYQALQAADPNGKQWDTVLKTKNSFLDYQSSQGANNITASLFAKGSGDWQTATQAIVNLQTASLSSAVPKVKQSAIDLCKKAGNYDTYDFCSDITSSTPITADTVTVACLQSYWQELGGKPAGTAYPTSKTLSPTLGTIKTWTEYKNAVNALKTQTKSTSPIVQRTAMMNFYGVLIGTALFSPKTITGAVLWLDAKDGNTILITSDQKVVTWKDKSGKANDCTQTMPANQPLYTLSSGNPMISFSSGTTIPIPSPYLLVKNYFTLFVVEQRMANPSSYFLNGPKLQLGYSDNTHGTMIFNTTTVSGSIGPFQSTSEPIRIWRFHCDSTGKKVCIQSKPLASSTDKSVLPSWDGFIGGTYTGKIAEVLLYNPAIDSEDNRLKVEGYLAWKWGIQTTLDATHPYASAAP